MGDSITTPTQTYYLTNQPDKKKKKRLIGFRGYLALAFIIIGVFASIYPSNWILIPYWVSVAVLLVTLTNNYFLQKIVNIQKKIIQKQIPEIFNKLTNLG